MKLKFRVLMVVKGPSWPNAKAKLNIICSEHAYVHVCTRPSNRQSSVFLEFERDGESRFLFIDF